MEKQVLGKFRRIISARRDAFLAWLKLDPERKKIHLGGIPEKEVEKVIDEHNSALDRIESGDFGCCTECDGDVEPEMLELDFTACVCLDDYSEAQKRILEKDLELAAKVQRQLLPYTIPDMEGIQIAAHTEPAHVVGGDYFDFFSYTDGDQGVVIADVMGKGLSASMLMSNLQASLRILGPEYASLSPLANRLNKLFCNNLKSISFITLFLLRIDKKNRVIHYCNAGHNPAIYRKSNGKTLWLKPTGPAIGLTSSASYRSEELPFESGDLLLMYTDGLIEAQNNAGNEFGKGRLGNYVKEHSEESADSFLGGLRKEVKDFAQTFQDDMTIVVIKII